MLRMGMVRQVRLGSVWQGMAMARLGRLGLVRHGVSGAGAAGMVRHGEVRLGALRRGTFWQVGLGVSRTDLATRGTAGLAPPNQSINQ